MKRLPLGSLLFVVLLLATPCRPQLSTADHLADPGFWPTQAGKSRDDYVGVEVCASCHAGKAATQKTTAMAQTSMRAGDADILNQHSDLHFRIGKYRYDIHSDGSNHRYSVTDGAVTQSANLLWAFGNGRVGQSYLFKKDDGKFYEARVTFFDTLKNLHFTPSRELTSPKDVAEAMDRQVPDSEVEHCFSCHTTASKVEDRFDEQKLMVGVSCEACHGPGAKHVAAAKVATMAGTPDAARGTIFNAAQLDPADSVDFCGSCHATFWDVKLTGAKGGSTAKAQPFRLEESRCWGKGDARLTCIACHDPHQPLQKDASSYDPMCVDCHTNSATDMHKTKICPKATRDCVTCHMPKIYVPEMHYSFTDHRIRVVRENETYPD